MILVAHQELTKEWWEARNHFELFVSEVVLNEISLGDPEAAKCRIDRIAGIPLLELTEESREFAHRLVRLNLVPALPAREARSARRVVRGRRRRERLAEVAKGP